MAQEKRTPSSIENNDRNATRGIGPFLAKVVGHLDTTYMGTLEVELLKTTDSGNNSETSGQVIQARYLSPFYGVTPFRDTSENEGHQYTQKSYGMWMVPPDVGTLVVVIKIEGMDDRAYWIGCVQDQYMNFMVPNGGQATTEYNNQDTTRPLPVAEYNKRNEDAAGRNPTQFIHPVNEDFSNVLQEQGLDGCRIRGLSSSSARREAPSHVFGISTPGPQDRRPGAPTGTVGTQEASTQMPFNRLGGTSFVMDDGDPAFIRATHASAGPPTYVNRESGEAGGDPTIPANELVRIRTRTGHQILLHNSEDLIYIANSRGTAWIELTSNGKIDIYAADSISIHTEGDFNLKADGNINMQADGDINLKASGDGRLTAANTHIKSSTHTEEAAGGIFMNSGGAAEAVEPERVPAHEPWDGHESNFGGQCNLPDTFRQRGTQSGGGNSTAPTTDTTTSTTDTATPIGDSAADVEQDDAVRNRGISDSAVAQFTGPQ